MTMILFAKNKLGFLDGSISWPLVDPLHGAKGRANNMILASLLNSIHCDLVLSVLYVDFVYIVWEYL